MRQTIIDAAFLTGLDDLGLRHAHEGSVNVKSRTLHSGFRGEIRHFTVTLPLFDSD